MSEIFVFGSNLAGIHGAGAAKWAHENCHAVMGEGIGRTGSAYAIPTKDMNIKTMSLDRIRHHIHVFLDYAESKPRYRFKVSRIGCGLAGYKDPYIAPFFMFAPSNCILPIEWKKWIQTPGLREYWEWKPVATPNRAEVEDKERSLAAKFRTKE
jgi:hypothetical protein